MATKKATKQIDVNELLNSVATSKSNTNSKSKVPTISVSPAVKAMVSKKRDLVAKIDSLKAEDEIISADIINAVVPSYEKLCGAQFSSSIRVPAVDESTVTISWKSQYSPIPTDSEATIKSVVGDNYDHWFKKESVITVKEGADLNELVKMVGAENFAKFFGVVQNIVPTANFTEEKYRMLDEEKRNSLNNIVKQYKPSIRTK